MKWVMYKNQNWMNIDDITIIEKDTHKKADENGEMVRVYSIKYNNNRFHGWRFSNEEERDRVLEKLKSILKDAGLLVEID